MFLIPGLILNALLIITTFFSFIVKHQHISSIYILHRRLFPIISAPSQWQDEAPQRRTGGGFHLLCLSSPSWCLWEQWPPSYPQLYQNPGTFPDPEHCHSPQTLPICRHLQRETRYEPLWNQLYIHVVFHFQLAYPKHNWHFIRAINIEILTFQSGDCLCSSCCSV